MACDPSKPFNGHPALPLQVDLESRAVLKAQICRAIKGVDMDNPQGSRHHPPQRPHRAGHLRL